MQVISCRAIAAASSSSPSVPLPGLEPASRWKATHILQSLPLSLLFTPQKYPDGFLDHFQMIFRKESYAELCFWDPIGRRKRARNTEKPLVAYSHPKQPWVSTATPRCQLPKDTLPSAQGTGTQWSSVFRITCEVTGSHWARVLCTPGIFSSFVPPCIWVSDTVLK